MCMILVLEVNIKFNCERGGEILLATILRGRYENKGKDRTGFH